MKENSTWLASKGNLYLQFLVWTKCASDVGQYWSLWWWVLGATLKFSRQSTPGMFHETEFLKKITMRMLLRVCYTLAYLIKDMTSHRPLQWDSLKWLCLILQCESYIKSPPQQNSSFGSLCIYVTSLLFARLEQPLCWWLRRLLRPGWAVASEGSHTVTTVVSIRERVYMLLWRVTLCRMARSSSSS